jgi:hypothetical protein
MDCLGARHQAVRRDNASAERASRQALALRGDAHVVHRHAHGGGELEDGVREFGAWNQAQMVMNGLACESTPWIGSRVPVRMREFQELILLEWVEYRFARRRIEAPQPLHLRLGQL